MKKFKKFKEYDEYDQYNEDRSDRGRKLNEKRMRSALRARNFEALVDIEDDYY